MSDEPTAAQPVVGLVLHHHRAEVAHIAARALEWCASHGCRGVLPPIDAALIGRLDLSVDESSFGSDLALCLSVGGDGTILRAARLTVGFGAPLLGVNAGRLGYLTEIDPDQLETALDEWQAGALLREHRMLLEVSFEGATPVDDGSESPLPRTVYALNEVVVERAQSGHTVSVKASIAGRHFTRYLADALVIATPTGSTAYSLSAGGPIVEPNFEALVLTPVAAHMVFDRSLVVAPTTEVRLTVEGYRDGIVTIDGKKTATLSPGASVICRGSSRRATFLIRGDRDFHTILKEKFGLSDR